jgi:DNA polymerase-3 subunit beta
MGVNEPRPVLNGCHIITEEGQISVVACDGFKLAVCSNEAELKKLENSARGVEFSFIVPVKSVNELIRLLSDEEDDTVTVYMSHRNMVVVFDGLVFFTRLIVGEYVDYNRIIIKNHKIAVYADRARMLAALEKASLITEERIALSVRSHVRVEVEGDVMKVSAVSTAGSIYDEFDIEHEGDDLSIAFNNRFLIDALKAAEQEEIRIEFGSSNQPIIVKPLEGEAFFYLVLPVRI